MADEFRLRFVQLVVVTHDTTTVVRALTGKGDPQMVHHAANNLFGLDFEGKVWMFMGTGPNEGWAPFPMHVQPAKPDA